MYPSIRSAGGPKRDHASAVLRAGSLSKWRRSSGTRPPPAPADSLTEGGKPSAQYPWGAEGRPNQHEGELPL